MTDESLAAALEREHHEIDEGIAAYLASPTDGRETGPLVRAAAALRRHIYLEEELLFPRLRRAGLAAALMVMLREHGQLWAGLDELDEELRTHVDDPMVAKHCRDLAVQLQHHNSKEERVIYPDADQELDPAEAVRLTDFLQTGELPAGWVCTKARPAAT